MIEQFPAELRGLVRRMLLYESKGQWRSPTELAEAADRACQKLYDQMAQLFGHGGFHALIARSLKLTGREFPELRDVEDEPQGEACLRGLHGSLEGADFDTARQAVEAVFANLINLLNSFIGTDMTMRLLARAWPEVPIREKGPGSEEAKK